MGDEMVLQPYGNLEGGITFGTDLVSSVTLKYKMYTFVAFYALR